MANDLNLDTIGEVESGLLERRFEKEETSQVVHDMKGDKAPRLD